YPVSVNIFSADAWEHRQVRQHRLLEMTEFEWFHWWPFDVLVTMIALSLIVTTLRRIRFSVINLGVWMIHSGIVILIIGSLIYFGTKVEGDTPVSRRVLVMSMVDEVGETVGEERLLIPFPGNSIEIGDPSSPVIVSVLGTDPDWELLSGDDAGRRVFSVNLMVDGFEQRFIRQVLAGYPEFTEDLINTGDPDQPMQRAVKVTGERILEPTLKVSLQYAPQDEFFLSEALSKNWAVYLREKGTTRWIERPVPASTPLSPDKRGVPLYNDYVADSSSVFLVGNRRLAGEDPLSVRVPSVSPEDPLAGTDLMIDSYLRYAQMQTRLEPGTADDPLNPIIDISLSSPGAPTSSVRLEAFDPELAKAEDGVLNFKYITDESRFDTLQSPATITVSIPSLGVDETRTVDSFADGRPWLFEDGTYRVMLSGKQDDLTLDEATVSVLFADITTPTGSFRRWVFDDPALTRDIDPDDPEASPADSGIQDDSITVTYTPGSGSARLLFVAGPEPELLRAILRIGDSEPRVLPIVVGEPVKIRDQLFLTVDEYFPRAVASEAPLIVPSSQRDRDMGNLNSWVRAIAPGIEPTWLRFQKYPFEGPSDLLGRFKGLYAPTMVRVQSADGAWKDIEMVFSRERVPLPDPIALETFELETYIGGYSDGGGSIRDYRSVLRFDDDGKWGDPRPVSMNKPVEHDGLWFFQSQWDPPINASINGGLPSKGLGYTVLGVGNRNGVYTQLLGCVIAVIGMIYAFYVKPLIKRRRRERVLAGLAANTPSGGS
ncbi:MAG TPA: hypothetical protein DCX60_01875, partial [Phycisphaerales bacterium]|nr:hypothetical protein [Phycisphaerales bacterium]